ncbi:hypothetical protein ACLQ25_09720 [Micromonospora sp. DT44]|uniref:AlbA family DNA-binding domain-containing protein n=1 Tax=Micromonospora sp. DT44 TaxID=3393439 RepID=UPI003CF9535F
MPLDFDSSRAPMTSRDYLSLAMAVKDARDSDESDWIEWKSTLDLASVDGKVAVARGIIGMANRSPSVASSHCEGRSFFVVGIHPGAVPGIDEIDPAVLEDRLRPYLGDDGPRFAAHWVSVEGRTALVIEVAAPRDGDPVHHIRKEGPGVRDGDIFVRRGAKTTRASSVELQRLFQRARSTSGLRGISLTMTGPPEVSTVDFSDEMLDRWISTTRRSLLASLPGPPESGIEFNPGLEISRQIQSTLVRISRLFPQTEEDRTPEEYRSEVTKYLEKCRVALPHVLRRTAYSKLPPVQLALTNDTEENYSAVQVVVYLPGTVSAERPLMLAANEARLPKPPRPYGPYMDSPLGRQVDIYRHSAFQGSSENVIFGNVNVTGPPGVQIDNGGSVTLTFSPVDLRPLECDVLLTPVVLLPQVPIDGSIVATWTATSKSVRGVEKGSLEIPLAIEPASISDFIQ